jgi:hypothetical protein
LVSAMHVPTCGGGRGFLKKHVARARKPARRRLATTEALYRASWCEVLCVGKGFNHKIMIKIQESSPSIMVIRNLWSARV